MGVCEAKAVPKSEDAAASDRNSPEDAAASDRNSPEDAAASDRNSPEDAAASDRNSPEDAAASDRNSPEDAAASDRNSPEDAASSVRNSPEDAAASDRNSPEDAASSVPNSPEDAAASVRNSSEDALSEKFSNLNLSEESTATNSESGGDGSGVAPGSDKLEENGGVEKDSESARMGKEGREEKGGKFRYPQRPEEQNCSYYAKTGSSKFGMNCKFSHPSKKKTRPTRVKSKKPEDPSQVSKEKKRETLPKRVVETKHKQVDEQGQEDLLKSDGWTEDEKPVGEKRKEKMEQKEPKDLEDTKRNPSNRVKQSLSTKPVGEKRKGKMEQKESKDLEDTKRNPSNRVKQSLSTVADKKAKEAPAERGGQKECKFYFMSGVCKFGSSCKFIHHQGKSDDLVELNFLGLPIRPGKKECPYYMRNGNCKFSTNCMHHHPDPTAVAERHPVSTNQNGETRQQNVPVPITSWSEQRPLNEPYPFLDASPSYIPGMILPPQGLHPNHDWNGHQVPVFASDIQIHNYSASPVHHAPHIPDTPVHQEPNINEYPERPGQPECQFFKKNGSCRFKSACKYHHPKSQLPCASAGVLSPIGLPLKPDQPVCPHYGRYGVCKCRPACKFDHPMSYRSSTSGNSIPDSNTTS